ncbi:MAG: hypothetical protein GWN31_12495 [Candidatus Thorarchaeota archaeon]|nr:hypothetical protein [Candidatus Thorarchaeota archaeon]NIW14717.1 hypothetical protein [Candidatus Thorarchaeota archaeon]
MLAEAEETKEEGEFELQIKWVAFALPGGMLVGGLLVYLLTKAKLFGLFIMLTGLLSVLGIMIPLITLESTKRVLQEQEREIKLERLKDKVKNKTDQESNAGG